MKSRQLYCALMVTANDRQTFALGPRRSGVNGAEPAGFAERRKMFHKCAPQLAPPVRAAASSGLGAGAKTGAKRAAKTNERISVPRLPTLPRTAALAARVSWRKLPDKLFHLQRFSTSSATPGPGSRKTRQTRLPLRPRQEFP
jgi:hypothetical protein